MKVERNSPKWKKTLIQRLIEDYADQYKSCNDCGLPTHKRYICANCGSVNP